MQTKIKFFVYTVAACLTLSSLTGCLESGDAEEDQPSQEEPAPTDGSQTKAQLAGYGRKCEVLTSAAGSALNGKALVRYIELSADGTYYSAVNITLANDTCSYGSATNGAGSAMQYSVRGTWSVGGTAGTPSNGTKITLTPTSQPYLTTYNLASGNAAEAITNWARTTCNVPGMSASGGTTTFQPTLCNEGSSDPVKLGTPPSLGQAQYNIIFKNGSGDYQMGATQGYWSANAGMYPTSFTDTWQ
jgi:hypothetical protein